MSDQATDAPANDDATDADPTEAPPTNGQPVDEPPVHDGPTLTIDGQQVDAQPGELVIAAAQRSGVYIPRFCYHERMRPVGMCRMCLVHIDTGRGPQLQPSCMVPVADGMTVNTAAPAVKRVQEGVLEHLLINHPLDCPVCDKGGECPLQDQTLAYGPGESRFTEQKRHFAKPIPVSQLVDLDRERCILCDRCTRFADEVAGDPLIRFTERGNETQITTFPGEPFNSYFSGNTVQICPVGALTASPYRFKARPWDLTETTSTCTTCSVGCRVNVHTSRDQVLRYLGSDINSVNHSWLCDKGRFAFEANRAPNRLLTALRRAANDTSRDAAGLHATSHGDALNAAAHAVATARPGAIAVLGGARGTNEDAYAWAKLAATTLGGAHVDSQLADELPAELTTALSAPPLAATIADACAADVVLLACADAKEELPVLHLRLRGAALNGNTKLVALGAAPNSLADQCAETLGCLAGDEAQTLDAWLASDNPLAASLPEMEVVVVLGRAGLAQHPAGATAISAVVRSRLPNARFLLANRRGNSRGAADMGLTPAATGGRSAQEILQACADGNVDVLFLLGADPLADFGDRYLAALALATANTIVAVDGFLTESSAMAHIVFPAALFGEKAGTTTNLEGRVSAVAHAVTAPGDARPDWMLAAELGFACAELVGPATGQPADSARADGSPTDGGPERAVRAEATQPPDWNWNSVADITSEIARTIVGYQVLLDAPATALNGEGVLTQPAASDEPSSPLVAQVPDRPPVDGYGFRLVTSRKLYDAGTIVANSASFAGLAPPAQVQLHPSDAKRLGVADGNQMLVTNDRAAVAASVAINRRVPAGNAVVSVNAPAANDPAAANTTDPADTPFVTAPSTTRTNSLIDLTAGATNVRLSALAADTPAGSAPASADTPTTDPSGDR